MVLKISKTERFFINIQIICKMFIKNIEEYNQAENVMY